MLIRGDEPRRRLRIISLADYSGNWPHYFVKDGYDAELVDIKHGKDLFSWKLPLGDPVYGVLAAPPCTDVTVSGARWWKEKDADGRTEASLKLFDRCAELINEMNPVFWIIENPVGRLDSLRPDTYGRMRRVLVHPWQYAGYAPNPESERYTKATVLRGVFQLAPRSPREPIMYTTADGKRGSWMWARLGGKSERTKELRSTTPLGLAKATWLGNRGGAACST